MLNGSKREFWKKIKADSLIRISDLQALESSRKSGKGIEPVQYHVRGIREIQQYDSQFESTLPTTWFMFQVEDSDDSQNILIARVVKDGVKDIVDVGLFYTPPEYESATRRQLVENDFRWIFDAPEDPESFNPKKDCCNLEFADCTNENMPPFTEMVDGKEQEIFVTYKRKMLGTQFGVCFEDGSKIPIMITEYSAKEDYKNPRFVVMEEGFLEEDGTPKGEGGLVTILFGCSIDPVEIDVL